MVCVEVVIMSLFIVHYKDDKRPYHIEEKVNDRKMFYDWKGHMDEKMAWCEQNFGHRNEKFDNPRWTADPRYYTGNFCFKNEKDAMWFIMRWG